jgi:hypothetical protein
MADTKIHGITSGMLHGGAVVHLSRNGEKGACGRSYICGEIKPGAPLCKTCSRIIGIQSLGELHIATEYKRIPWTHTQYTMASEALENCQGTCALESAHDFFRFQLANRQLKSDGERASITIAKGGKGDHSVNGKGKPARKPRCGTSPAQFDLINRVIFEIGELNRQAADILLTIYTEEWHNTVSWTKISPAIDSLFAAKRSESAKVVKVESAKVEKLGLKEDDICVMDGAYYKIHRAKAGHLYAIVWADECWNWDATPKGVIKRLTAEMLATAEQAAEFGHTFHRCVFCTLPLTDPRSEGVGYGPTCADKRGLPWG